MAVTSEPRPFASLALAGLVLGCAPGQASLLDDGGETTMHGEGDGDGDGDGDSEPTETGEPVPSYCGDGIEDPDEECDLGQANSDSGACTSACAIATCGDGLVYETFEDCDAGGLESADCDPDCSAPLCGDGYLNASAGELCDDGNPYDGDICPGSCVPAVCGDGYVLDSVEKCDDGNAIDDDDCANDCTLNLNPLCDEPHPILSDYTRVFEFNDGPGGVQLCDRLDAPNPSPDWLGPGWYRVGDDDLEFLLHGGPPEDYACGGTAGGWHDGDWPAPPDGILETEICFAFGDDPCAWSVMAQVVSCWNYELWNLPEVPDCDLRYCSGYVTVP